MQYLVQMKIVPEDAPRVWRKAKSSSRSSFAQHWSCARSWRMRKRSWQGGPISGTINLALVVKADSAKELDDLVTSLPVWPRTETAITPLTAFDDRALSIERRLSDSRAKRSTS
jgi:muconolactone delta-isomerase